MYPFYALFNPPNSHLLEYDPISNVSPMGIPRGPVVWVTFFSGFIFVFICRQSTIQIRIVSYTEREDHSLYSMRSVNSHHTIKIVG